MENDKENEISQNNQPQAETPRKLWKFWLMLVFINIIFLAVIVKLFIVQVINSDQYKEAAKKQHESKVTLTAKRGNIYDRNGNLLASSLQKITVVVDPSILNDDKMRKTLDKICTFLSNETGVPKEKYIDKIQNSDKSYLILARGIDPWKSSKLKEIDDRCVFLISEPKRNYPFANAVSQLIGFTDNDNVGKIGLEKSWDSVLQGKDGFIIMSRDAIGKLHFAADLPYQPAMDGNSLYLTIDIKYQRVLEYELQHGVLKTNSSSGAAIALDPSTGEILAMASYPDFDPNNINSEAIPNMKNRAITDVYEPGSTFKGITAAAALEENLFSPDDILDGHNGSIDYGQYTITDVHPIGRVTFREALEQSSNVIFSSVGYTIPDNDFYKYIRNFGFGLNLGIDLPGESAGRLPKPDNFTAAIKRFMGFGYGIMATPLQVLCAYGAIANRGDLMRPYVVKKAVKSNGQLLFETRAEKIRKVITEKTAKTLTDMLSGVVSRGTGKSAILDKISVAGKTGTTKLVVNGAYSDNYIATFVGFYPAEKPEITLIVVLDKPIGAYYAGSTAAPIFRNICARFLNLKQLDNQVKNDSQSGDSTNLQRNLRFIPEINGLDYTKAENLLKQYGINLESVDKSSIIFDRKIKSGEKLESGSFIRVETDTNSIKKPDVTGLSLRHAIRLLQNSGYKVKVNGYGLVKRQEWSDKASAGKECTIYCN